MTSPSENDDDWAELARELARDKPPIPPPLPTAETSQARAESPADEGEFSEVVTDADDNGGEEFDTVEEAEAEPNAESATGEAQPGTGRKRRRRRRRRRKGGAGQPADTIADSPEEAAEGTETVAGEESSEGDFEAAGAGGYVDEADGDSDTEVLAADADSDEDAGGELLRELIANWNVPSWDDVVAGLHRPER
jgi:ribonuclease E